MNLISKILMGFFLFSFNFSCNAPNSHSNRLKLVIEINPMLYVKSVCNFPVEDSIIQIIEKIATDPGIKGSEKISRFCNAVSAQYGKGKLTYIFSGEETEIGLDDNDEIVLKKLLRNYEEKSRISYNLLINRVEKLFGDNALIEFDEKNGLVNLELNNISDNEKAKKVLLSSGNLEFWELYNIDELGSSLMNADKALSDSLKKKKFDYTDNPLLRYFDGFFRDSRGSVLNQNGVPQFTPNIGFVSNKDSAKLAGYLTNKLVTNCLPKDVKFLFGKSESINNGKDHFCSLYAIKMRSDTKKAPLDGSFIKEARQDYDERGKPSIKFEMNQIGSLKWEQLTTKNIGKPLAIIFDDVVLSAPMVNGPITGGNSEISRNFSVEEAQEIVNLLKAGSLPPLFNIIEEQVIK